MSGFLSCINNQYLGLKYTSTRAPVNFDSYFSGSIRLPFLSYATSGFTSYSCESAKSASAVCVSSVVVGQSLISNCFSSMSVKIRQLLLLNVIVNVLTHHYCCHHEHLFRLLHSYGVGRHHHLASFPHRFCVSLHRYHPTPQTFRIRHRLHSWSLSSLVFALEQLKVRSNFS